MYRLSQIIVILILYSGYIYSQNPHGDDLKIDCAKCHTSDSWDIDLNKISFDHSVTSFALDGMHKYIDCSDCHQSLILSKVKRECIECHTDIHNNTLPEKCDICHKEDDWLIDDMPVMHEEFGFVFTGAHITLDCSECHDKSVELIFEPISSDCYSCHLDSYNSTENPDHVVEKFSFECYQCHDIDSDSWIISHDFFPLEKGHDLPDCISCHSDYNYIATSPDCYSCHVENYENASNPDHSTNSFSKDCKECHSLEPGWTPAEYTLHDNIFPVYSGKHEGEWNLCTDCHLDPNNYSDYTCIDCHEHEKTQMDEKHDGESGYVYESTACLKCHPEGDK